MPVMNHLGVADPGGFYPNPTLRIKDSDTTKFLPNNICLYFFFRYKVNIIDVLFLYYHLGR